MVLQIVAGTVLFYNVVEAQLACADVYRGERGVNEEKERQAAQQHLTSDILFIIIAINVIVIIISVIVNILVL